MRNTPYQMNTGDVGLNQHINYDIFDEQERQRRLERRRMGINNPNSYGGQNPSELVTKEGNQGSPINVQTPLQPPPDAFIPPPQFHQNPDPNYYQGQQSMNYPGYNPMINVLQSHSSDPNIAQQNWNLTGHQQIHPLTQLYETNPYIMNQKVMQSPRTIRQYEGAFIPHINSNGKIQSSLIQFGHLPQQIEQSRQNRFQAPSSSHHQHRPHHYQDFTQEQQQDLYEFYKNNVNNQMFNQRTKLRAENYTTRSQSQTLLKHQYAKVLEFQLQEKEAMKAKQKSQERSPSPENFGFFDKFGAYDKLPQDQIKQEKQRYLRDVLSQQIEEKENRKAKEKRDRDQYELKIDRAINNLNRKQDFSARGLSESVIVGGQEQSTVIGQEGYKDYLIDQINQKKRKREEEKKRKLEQEARDEERVKRELAELNVKYLKEIGQYHQDTMPSEIIQKEDSIELPFKNEEILKTERSKSQNSKRVHINLKKDKSNKKRNEPDWQGDNSTFEELEQPKMLQTKKQVNAQMQRFNKEMTNLKKQQEDMLSNYQKEIQALQKKKETILKDIKDTQQTQLQEQILNLQKTVQDLESKTKKPQSSPRHPQTPSSSRKYKPDGSSTTRSMKQIQNQTFNIQKPLKKQKEDKRKEKTIEQPITEQVKNQSKFQQPSKDDPMEQPLPGQMKQQNQQRRKQQKDEKMKEFGGQRISSLGKSQAKKYKIDQEEIISSEAECENPNDISSRYSNKDQVMLVAQDKQGFQNEKLIDENEQNKSSFISQAMHIDSERINPKKLSYKQKINQLQDSITDKKPQLTQNTKPPKAIKGKPAKQPGPKFSSQTQPSKITPITTPLPNDDQEVLSITNMLARVKTIDDDEEMKDPPTENQFQSKIPKPSSLKKVIPYQPKTNSNKNVKISFQQDAQTPVESEEQFQGSIQEDNGYYSRQQESPYEQMPNSYIQESRDMERQYYEDAIRNSSINNADRDEYGNIENRDEQEVEVEVDQIAGIPVQPMTVLEKVKEDLDPSKFTNFLYSKSLIHSEQDPYEAQENEEEENEIPLPLQEKGQYTLQEYDERDPIDILHKQESDPPLDQRLQEIQQLVQNTEKYANDFNQKYDALKVNATIKYNKNVERKLKEVEDILQDKKQKQERMGVRKSVDNINITDNKKRNSLLTELISLKVQQEKGEEARLINKEGHVDVGQEEEYYEEDEEELKQDQQFIMPNFEQEDMYGQEEKNVSSKAQSLKQSLNQEQINKILTLQQESINSKQSQQPKKVGSIQSQKLKAQLQERQSQKSKQTEVRKLSKTETQNSIGNTTKTIPHMQSQKELNQILMTDNDTVLQKEEVLLLEDSPQLPRNSSRMTLDQLRTKQENPIQVVQRQMQSQKVELAQPIDSENFSRKLSEELNEKEQYDDKAFFKPTEIKQPTEKDLSKFIGQKPSEQIVSRDQTRHYNGKTFGIFNPTIVQDRVSEEQQEAIENSKAQFEREQDIVTEKTEEILNKPRPRQSHLINFLLRSKPSQQSLKSVSPSIANTSPVNAEKRLTHVQHNLPVLPSPTNSNQGGKKTGTYRQSQFIPNQNRVIDISEQRTIQQKSLSSQYPLTPSDSKDIEHLKKTSGLPAFILNRPKNTPQKEQINFQDQQYPKTEAKMQNTNQNLFRQSPSHSMANFPPQMFSQAKQVIKQSTVPNLFLRQITENQPKSVQIKDNFDRQSTKFEEVDPQFNIQNSQSNSVLYSQGKLINLDNDQLLSKKLSSNSPLARQIKSNNKLIEPVHSNKSIQYSQPSKPPLPLPFTQQREKIKRVLSDIAHESHLARKPHFLPLINSRRNSVTSQPQTPTDYLEESKIFTENSRVNDIIIPIHSNYLIFNNDEIKISQNKNDPYLQNYQLRQKLSETNQMLRIDNETLLQKIRQIDKSIRPTSYGFPYINLTKPESEILEDPLIVNVAAKYSHNLAQTDFNQQQSISQSYGFQEDPLQNVQINKRKNSINAQEEKTSRLIQFAGQMNNDMIYEIVKNKVNEGPLSSKNFKNQQSQDNNRKYDQLLNFLQQENNQEQTKSQIQNVFQEVYQNQQENILWEEPLLEADQIYAKHSFSPLIQNNPIMVLQQQRLNDTQQKIIKDQSSFRSLNDFVSTKEPYQNSNRAPNILQQLQLQKEQKEQKQNEITRLDSQYSNKIENTPLQSSKIPIQNVDYEPEEEIKQDGLYQYQDNLQQVQETDEDGDSQFQNQENYNIEEENLQFQQLHQENFYENQYSQDQDNHLEEEKYLSKDGDQEKEELFQVVTTSGQEYFDTEQTNQEEPNYEMFMNMGTNQNDITIQEQEQMNGDQDMYLEEEYKNYEIPAQQDVDNNNFVKGYTIKMKDTPQNDGQQEQVTSFEGKLIAQDTFKAGKYQSSDFIKQESSKEQTLAQVRVPKSILSNDGSKEQIKLYESNFQESKMEENPYNEPQI